MLINNDCLLALDELEENSVDSIVTDPPYELNFMGKGWDNAGYKFIGIEKDAEYCKIAEARIKHIEQTEQQQRLV